MGTIGKQNQTVRRYASKAASVNPIVSYEMMIRNTERPNSKTILAMLIGLAVLCLAIHFVIYHQTQASAFINQPEFYYNRFVIRDSNGQWIKDVSMKAGVLSYLTAGLAIVSSCGAVMLTMKAKKKESGS